MSNIFGLNWKDVLSSVVSGVVISVLAFIGNTTNIFSLDWKQVVSVVVLAVITSLLKSFTTDSQGRLGGVLPIK